MAFKNTAFKKKKNLKPIRNFNFLLQSKVFSATQLFAFHN